jgi:hypothetical protein
VFDIGDRHYLYPTGTIPELGYYPHAHVPAPLRIVRHAGDSPPDRILSDVLLLTKMNWNSARYAEREPITTKFADEVGEVLKEVSPTANPRPSTASTCDPAAAVARPGDDGSAAVAARGLRRRPPAVEGVVGASLRQHRGDDSGVDGGQPVMSPNSKSSAP